MRRYQKFMITLGLAGPQDWYYIGGPGPKDLNPSVVS